MSRPPLPFGLGREPSCDNCLSPDVPLPAAGTPLHDQVAHSLSSLFSTFFATSLRYLGVSEILDWLEQNHTIDAWILTGLEQGRTPSEVGNESNLAVGRGALKSVIKAALEQEDEAWATSLREVGFSSGMSMAFEGVIAQLKYNKSSPLPCLHTLITPSGLAMLKSAPLKHAFPVCPPRTAPSSHSLLTSIRADIASKTLQGSLWKQSAIWKPQVRRAFAKYHAMVKEVAEDIVCDPAFSKEYHIFLESISQPINLFDLISQDFSAEFGLGACKGLLGVGDAGGMNLRQIMDFCAAKRPSELLARVKQRVAEKQEQKQEKEKAKVVFDKMRARIEAIKRVEEGMSSSGKDQLRRKTLGEERDGLERLVELELAAASDAVGSKKEQQVDDPCKSKQGSSKDLGYKISSDISDPFAACAPRAVSPALTSSKAKGKGKAVIPSSNGRAMSRYSSATRGALPPRSMSPLSSKPSTHAPSSPLASSIYTPPPSPPHRSSKPSATALRNSGDTDGGPRRSTLVPNRATIESTIDHQPGECCAACAAELAFATRSESNATLSSALPLLPSGSSTSNYSITSSPTPTQRSSSPEDRQHQPLRRSNSPLATRPVIMSKINQVVEDSLEISANAIQDAALKDFFAGTGKMSMVPVNPDGSSIIDEEGELEVSTGGKKKPKKKKKARATAVSQINSGEVEPGTTVNALAQKNLEVGESNGSVNGHHLVTPPATTVLMGAGTVKTSSLRNVLKGAASTEHRIATFVPTHYPLSNIPPSLACPPDRCSGDVLLLPSLGLDSLLYQVCLEGFRYELIDSLIDPLIYIRDSLAKEYLLLGGKMKGDEVRVNSFLKSVEKTLWERRYPKIVEFTQATLALSLQKLMEVLRAQVGKLCICRLSQRSDVLTHATTRLAQCATADSKLPLHLGDMEIEGQPFMRWCHAQLRAGSLSGPEWEGRERSYRVSDFLVNFGNAFDVLVERMMIKDPYAIARDMMLMLEWQGGVRTFESAMRLGNRDLRGAGAKLSLSLAVEDLAITTTMDTTTIAKKRTSGADADEKEKEEEKQRAKSPLGSWTRVLGLATAAFSQKLAFSVQQSLDEKRRGNLHFNAGEFNESVLAFETASIINPTDATYYTNAAAARLKLGTSHHLKEAVADCTSALDIDSTNVKALYRRGIALARLGKWSLALNDLKTLVERCPDNEEGLEALKWVQSKMVR